MMTDFAGGRLVKDGRVGTPGGVRACNEYSVVTTDEAVTFWLRDVEPVQVPFDVFQGVFVDATLVTVRAGRDGDLIEVSWREITAIEALASAQGLSEMANVVTAEAAKHMPIQRQAQGRIRSTAVRPARAHAPPPVTAGKVLMPAAKARAPSPAQKRRVAFANDDACYRGRGKGVAQEGARDGL
jgi:hypothetical protein